MNRILPIVLGNFPLFSLILALFFSVVFRRGKSFGESLSRYLLLLPIGLGGIWGYYYHAFHPEMAAKFIGWANSPFQFEVAVSNLGVGLMGVIGFWQTRNYVLAVAIMVSSFLWGAAVNHIAELLSQGNYAPGNAGSILFTDILIPAALWLGYFLWSDKK